MAKKTKKQEEVIVEVENVQEATAPKKKRVVRKKKATAAPAPQITYGKPTDQLHALTVHERISAVKLKDNGDVDLTQLTKAEKSKYLSIASSLDAHDMMSINNFGSDLSTAMGAQSNKFLQRQMGRSNSNEVTKLLNNLLGELQLIDISDLKEQSSIKRFLAQIPGLKKLITSIESIKAKYSSIEKNVDGIVNKMEEAKLVVLSDNNMLEQLFQNNKDYVAQLGDIIIGGKLKSQELAEQLELMKQNQEDYDPHEISDLENYTNRLDKRLTDLSLLRYQFRMSLTQIRMIQQSNLTAADNIESQIKMGIPAWKNALSVAMALYDQKQTHEISTKVGESLNKSIVATADMMYKQTIEIEKANQKPIIKIEALQEATNKLINTVNEVKKIQENAVAERKSIESKIEALNHELNDKTTAISTDAQRHIISRELRGELD